MATPVRPHGQRDTGRNRKEGAVPITSITFSDMSWNRTGTWRYLRPRFVRRPSPCNEACPAGTDVEGFLALAGQRRYGDALERILLENPLPGICGRVCYHPCEASCNRSHLDEPVGIQALERFVSDAAEAKPVHIEEGKTQRIAIVGSGPAGLSCAYHLARFGYRVTIFEKEPSLGGMLRWGIPPYRLPREVLDREIERVLSLGIEVRTRCFVGSDIPWEEIMEWDAVFLATGAHGPRQMGILGEEGPGVSHGLEFLKAFNRGDLRKLHGTVAVIGGGNTAIDCARVALRMGARPTVLYRRDREQMPAIEAEVEEAIHEGVEVEFLTSPIAIRRDGAAVVGLECTRNRLGSKGDDGRATPEPIPGSEFFFEATEVIVATGEVVNPNDVPPFAVLGPTGLEIDPWGKTSNEKIWAGGDVVGGPRMVVHAIGSGKRAALSIHLHLRGHGLDDRMEILNTGSKGSISLERYLKGPSGGAPFVNRVVEWRDVNPEYFEPMPRVKAPQASPRERKTDFREVNLGYGPEMAEKEASRCLHCGTCDLCGNCYKFCPDISIALGSEDTANLLDEEHCKGCGICVEECPRGAIVMEEDR